MIHLLSTIKVILSKYYTFFIPISTNFIFHHFCKYMGCDSWYHSIFHHDLICNSCIDLKKIIKDYQLSIYWSMGSYCIGTLNTLFDNL